MRAVCDNLYDLNYDVKIAKQMLNATQAYTFDALLLLLLL